MSNKLPPDIPPPCGDYGIKLPRTYYPDNMNKEYGYRYSGVLGG